MIVLDTNVILELMQENPNEIVSEWIGKQKPRIMSITTIVIAEIQRGILRLPKGKKREKLANNFTDFIEVAFNSRILTFDQHATIATRNTKDFVDCGIPIINPWVNH